jgi:F-type H+-transporting ATPase subunit alpha
VGGNAQPPAVKDVAGRLRLDLAQYRELAAFSQFATDLDADTQARLARGRLLTEILKQPQYSPLPAWQQVASIYAATEGAFDTVPISNVKTAQSALLTELEKKQAKLVSELQKGAKATDDTKKTIVQIAQKIAGQYKAAIKETK